MATLTAEIELPAYLIPEVLELLGDFALHAFIANTDAQAPATTSANLPLLSVLIDPCGPPVPVDFRET